MAAWGRAREGRTRAHGEAARPDGRRGKGLPKGTPRARYPAKEHCSRCGVCDTWHIESVQESCAFIGEGMGRIPVLEEMVHGRQRDADGDEAMFGVTQDVFYATNRKPSDGVVPAQWTGIVTEMALRMLESGRVDGVICTAAEPDDRLAARPILATTASEVISAKGVKPCYSNALSLLEEVEAKGIRRLLFIGVGCQVQALRSLESALGLEALYVVGTNCTDNGERGGLDKFLNAASASPETVVGYEFMQDYRVHLKHLPGSPVENDYEEVPYFCLPSNLLAHGVIGEPCRSCFDYTNALADVVVGYMAVPYRHVEMTKHATYVTVRNERGRELVESISDRLTKEPVEDSKGLLGREALVKQTVEADDLAYFGRGPEQGAPRAIGNLIATLLEFLGPKGLEFARYSIEYHYLRNFLYTMRAYGPERAARHIPPYARSIFDAYDADGSLTKLLTPQENRHAFDVAGARSRPGP